MKISIIVSLLLIILMGCASVPKTLTAFGGSKSDGTVTLGYSYGAYERAVVDWTEGLATATKRCQAWGYKNAEAFGGQTSKCTNVSTGIYGGSCNRTEVTLTYQCLD